MSTTVRPTGRPEHPDRLGRPRRDEPSGILDGINALLAAHRVWDRFPTGL